MRKRVPVCITCDIDPTPEALAQEKRKAVKRSLDLFDQTGIKATFFWVAETAKDYSSVFNRIVKSGHEVGCHGLTHGQNEEYSSMSSGLQRDMLTKATSILKKSTGTDIVSFRGPRVKTSSITQKILVDLGYSSDSSVCSQRLDFISSNLINPGWIIAPRIPYHPNPESPYKRGDMNLLVVPVSALILPFVSGALYSFGLNWMKLFFDFLYRESLLTGKPVVYLFHPAEFAPKERVREEQYSVKVEGLALRRSPVIFEQNVRKRFELNRLLFEHMKSRTGVEFMTIRDFTENFIKG